MKACYLTDLEKDKTILKVPLWDPMAWDAKKCWGTGINYLNFDTGKSLPRGSEYTVWIHFPRGLALGNKEKRIRLIPHDFQLPTKILLLPYPDSFLLTPEPSPKTRVPSTSPHFDTSSANNISSISISSCLTTLLYFFQFKICRRAAGIWWWMMNRS